MYKLVNALAIFGIGFGALFKIQHYPGGSALLLLGIISQIVGYFITPKQIRTFNPFFAVNHPNTLLQITHGISVAIIILGTLFKVQHYPGSSILMISGWFLLTITLIIKALTNKIPEDEIDISDFGKKE